MFTQYGPSRVNKATRQVSPFSDFLNYTEKLKRSTEKKDALKPTNLEEKLMFNQYKSQTYLASLSATTTQVDPLDSEDLKRRLRNCLDKKQALRAQREMTEELRNQHFAKFKGVEAVRKGAEFGSKDYALHSDEVNLLKAQDACYENEINTYKSREESLNTDIDQLIKILNIAHLLKPAERVAENPLASPASSTRSLATQDFVSLEDGETIKDVINIAKHLNQS